MRRASLFAFGITNAVITAVGSEVAAAETRTFTYNVRGELVASQVSGGPADGVHTTIGYDTTANRTTYQVNGSKSPPRFSTPIAVPINGISLVVVPQ